MNKINVIIIISLFAPAIEKFTGFIYTDEIITLILGIAFIYLLLTQKIRLLREEKTIGFLLLGFYFIGIISSFIFSYQNIFISGLSGIFSIKAFIGYFGMRAVCQTCRHSLSKKKGLKRFIKLTIVISSMLLLFDLFVPIFDDYGYRLGVRVTAFIFGYFTDLCVFGVTCLVLLSFLQEEENGKPINIIYIIMSSFIVLRGGRFKSIGFLALFVAVYLIMPFVKKFKMKYVVATLPLVWVVAKDQIIYYSDITSARGRLIYVGMKILKDHFPIGSGFATFGTEFSRRYYSPLYDQYGMGALFGFSRKNSGYIADTMWGGVFAESGIIGGLCYIFALLYFIIMIMKLQIGKRMKMIIVSIVIYGIFESIGDSIFMSNRGVTIMVVLAYMITMCIRRCKKEMSS